MATEFQDFLAKLKAKTDIVEIGGEYLSLERRGQNFWACCPFHHEKTPSFSINAADQYYHCFGCGESGDVIKFVQNLENVEFMDAVKILAERAKMTIPQSGYDSGKTVELKRKKDAVLKILNDTAHFYLNNLYSGKAEQHVEYIQKRRIPPNIVRKFGLGASLDFTSLPRFLLSRGYDVKDILDSGVVNDSDGRLTDAQGGRLIYPIINAMDEVIAFGGRALKKVNFGKYKNTKDTLVFNKSKTLYNINLLKKLKREQTISEVIVVEGYMDTISLYEAGFKNVVASMGTSLTQEQARLLKRYTTNAYISYDGDGAGQKANLRGLEILKSEGITVRVVPLPEGLDPDDVIKQHGEEGYRKCLSSAMPLIDYKLKSAMRGLDLTKTEDMRKYVADALQIIRTEESASVREELLKRLREQTGISYESLKRDLNSSPLPAPAKTEEPVVKKRKEYGSKRDVASRFVIAAHLFGAKFLDGSDVSSVNFSNGVHAVIASYIKSKKLLDEKVSPAELLELFEENSEEYEELTRILDYSDGDALSKNEAEKYYIDCVRTMKIGDIEDEISSVKKKLSEADDKTGKKLAVKLQNLILQKEKIKNGI